MNGTSIQTKTNEGLKELFNKPICYLGHGHSLKEFEDNIEGFRNKDVIWVSLNRIEIVEPILKKIGKEIDVLLEYCPQLYKCEWSGVKLIKSLERGSSTEEFLHRLVDEEVTQTVFLFGVDGFNEVGSPSYYDGVNVPHTWKIRWADTQRFNEADRLKVLNVFNCSRDSHITLFKKISVKKAIRLC